MACHLHMDAELLKRRAMGIKRLKRGRLPCVVCCRGKQISKPFASRTERSNNILKIVHTDLCQPSKNKSEGGNKYFITFIDDYSGWREIYLLKIKDQAFEAFKGLKRKKSMGLTLSGHTSPRPHNGHMG